MKIYKWLSLFVLVFRSSFVKLFTLINRLNSARFLRIKVQPKILKTNEILYLSIRSKLFSFRKDTSLSVRRRELLDDRRRELLDDRRPESCWWLKSINKVLRLIVIWKNFISAARRSPTWPFIIPGPLLAHIFDSRQIKLR